MCSAFPSCCCNPFSTRSLRGHFAFLSVGVKKNLVKLLLVMGTAALDFSVVDGILEKFCSTWVSFKSLLTDGTDLFALWDFLGVCWPLPKLRPFSRTLSWRDDWVSATRVVKLTFKNQIHRNFNVVERSETTIYIISTLAYDPHYQIGEDALVKEIILG